MSVKIGSRQVWNPCYLICVAISPPEKRALQSSILSLCLAPRAGWWALLFPVVIGRGATGSRGVRHRRLPCCSVGASIFAWSTILVGCYYQRNEASFINNNIIVLIYPRWDRECSTYSSLTRINTHSSLFHPHVCDHSYQCIHMHYTH